MNYSPLRYPGGKSKLAPLVYQVMQNAEKQYKTYIEPFAGGAGVALTLLFENEVEQIVINDYDKAIYSFWRAITEETESFLHLLQQTPVTIDEWYKQKEIYKNENGKYSLSLGFATFFLNRTNRSGILVAGPIGGFEQSGEYTLDARFNKSELISRISRIAKQKSKIKVYNKEIRVFIKKYIPQYQEQAFIYFDPPYYDKGKVLYKNFFEHNDHKEIADTILSDVQCDWLITYDNVQEIEDLYNKQSIQKFYLRYSVAHNNNTGVEMLILKNSKHMLNQEQFNNCKIKAV